MGFTGDGVGGANVLIVIGGISSLQAEPDSMKVMGKNVSESAGGRVTRSIRQIRATSRKVE